jgi:hypothetical protein
LKEDVKFCPQCGTPVTPLVFRPERRIGREERRPITTRTLALISILVAVAVVSVVATALFSGFWHPYGRVVGSGNLINEEMGFSDFTKINVGSGFKVEITQSSSYGVNLTADDNVFDYIETSLKGDTLTIRLKWGYSYQSLTLRAKIIMPELYEVQLSGGTHGTVEDFSSLHTFVLGLSGGSFLDMDDMLVGDIQCDLSGGSHLTGGLTASGDAQFRLSGGSRVELDGVADDLFIDASGGSSLKVSDFPIHNADVNLSGGSRVTINLDGRLDANLSGGSKLYYFGEPTMGDINKSDDSTIEQK